MSQDRIDPLSPAQRSAVMARVRSKHTAPEMRVRRAIHRAGFRYRLHTRNLPGRPDLIFPRYRLAVFVNGCFWHWHGCRRSRMPTTNRDYWAAKIARNVERDRAARTALAEAGWRVEVIWECQLTDDVQRVIELLTRLRQG